MEYKRFSYFLLFGFAAVLVGVLFEYVPGGFLLKLALAILFLGTPGVCAVIEYRSTRRLHYRLDEFQRLLNESFNTILKESAEDMGLDEALQVLEGRDITPDQTTTLSRQLEYSRSLFSKEIRVFQQKNRIIKELNDKILFSKQQLEAVFDALEDGLCIVDNELRIFRLNKAFARSCGKDDLKQLLGKKSHECFPGFAGPGADRHALQVFATGDRVTGIPLESFLNGPKMYFIYSVFPIENEGRVIYVLQHFRNITVEKKMNEQLIRSANLASIGTMIAGIAHEMNNPLSGISGTASNMKNMPASYGLNDKGQERISDILDSAGRAEIILKGLLDLSRKKESQFVIMNLQPLVDRALQSIHMNGFQQVQKRIDIEPGLKPVANCDPDRVMQVLINLLTNATFAVLDRARRDIAVGRAYTPEVIVSVRSKGHDTFLLSVSDNGVGIPESKLSQIFDPFFTTRPPGQGTGLGLSICNKIMMEHNGRITVESVPDVRTVFSLEFPKAGME
ncbi:MAG: ATP-binding protein [Fibrobacterota bacterium]